MPNSSRKFSKASRLVSKQDFQSVFAQAAKISRPSLLLLYRSNTLRHARIGIIVGKNIYPHAVDRNRIRRVIRESFRAHQVELGAVDIVVLVRAKLDQRKSSLRDNVDQLWPKIQIEPASVKK